MCEDCSPFMLVLVVMVIIAGGGTSSLDLDMGGHRGLGCRLCSHCVRISLNMMCSDRILSREFDISRVVVP